MPELTTESGSLRLQPFVDYVAGVDLAHAAELPLSVVTGRLPVAGSLTEVAVTPQYLQRLGVAPTRSRGVVGTHLQLGFPRTSTALSEHAVRPVWIWVEIVGVVADGVGRGEVLAPIQLTLRAEQVGRTGPPQTARPSASPYTGLIVIARTLSDVSVVEAEVEARGYFATAPNDVVASVLRYLRVVQIVFAAIGLIALVVAALGIASSLLGAVRERRREIGILRAVGAKRSDVARLFLVEAAIIGFCGGTIGTAVGWAAARAISTAVNRYVTGQGLAPVGSGFNVVILAAGIGGSSLLAVAAGVLPAMRAALLTPVRAMSDQ